MAEVSNILQVVHYHQPELEQEHESQQPEVEEDSYIQSLDSSITDWPFHNNNSNDHLYAFDYLNPPLSPPHFSLSPQPLPHIYPDFEYDSDYSDSLTDMNYVTNLFESRQDYVPDDDLHQNSVSDSFFDSANENFGLRVSGSDDVEEDIGFGIGVEIDRVDSSLNGLRVAGIDSDSDLEDETDGANDTDGDLGLPVLWNSVLFDEQGDGNEEFEWEEVDDDREGLSSVIDRIEEITVSSEISSDDDDSVIIGEEAVRNLEWEVLLAVNNFNRDFDLENDDGVTYLAVEDGYTYAAEYNTLFEQFVETESALKGRPPAAKSVVENLPSVILTKEYVQENNVVCAVCKDDIFVEDKATRLPCSHHYHGECIVPWLNIRNTCPVCRFELPTDDADYERRKQRRDGLGLLDDLQVRYNLEVLP